MQAVEIIIRDYNPKTDDPYIYSTWTKYCWYSPTEEHTKTKKDWFTDKIQEIKQLLESGRVKIACFKEDPYVIAGYIVAKDGDVVWTCTKKDYHNQGIERLLTQAIQEKPDASRD